MPVYTYSAKDDTGQTVNGQVIAPNERLAANQVRDLGFFPMRVQPGGSPGQATMNGGSSTPAQAGFGAPSSFQENTGTSQTSSSFNVGGPSAIGQTTPLGHRQMLTDESALGTPFVREYGSWFERTFIYPIWTGVSLGQLAIFYRQFAAMLGAGMSVTGALNAMGQETNSSLRIAVFHMNKHIMAGGRLSEAMAMFPHIFKDVQREMIASSESTGGLDQVMIRLSTHLEAEDALRRMIKRETFMPKVNFVATFLLPGLVVAVVSGLQAYFQTQVMPLIHILEIAATVYVAGRYALKSKEIAITYDTVKAYLPYFGTTVRMLGLAKFSRALASLYSSGVLIPTAVGVAARTTGNAFLKWQMLKTVPEMMAGAGLTESFRKAGVFPSMFLSMLATGEQTGNLDQTLNKLAEYYEAESEVRLHQSVQALNVLIFLLVAVMVGMVVIKFYTGYFNSIFSAAGDS